MKQGAPDLQVDGSDLRVAIVAASWHTEVMDGLIAGARRGLPPDGGSLLEAFLKKQQVHERRYFFQVHGGPARNQAVPESERGRRLLQLGEVRDPLPVRFRGIRQHLIHQHAHIRIAVPHARKRQGQKFRINLKRTMNLRVRVGQPLLPQQEISIFPSNFSRDGIVGLRGAVVFFGFGARAADFERPGKIFLVVRRSRIEFYGTAQIGDGEWCVLVIEIQLAIPAEAVPILGVAGFDG